MPFSDFFSFSFSFLTCTESLLAQNWSRDFPAPVGKNVILSNSWQHRRLLLLL
jgi:hypothetical protein